MNQQSSTPSPYLIGAGIGLLDALSFATSKHGLGVTSVFENVAALMERRLAPDVTHINQYMQKREDVPKIDWEAFLVLGMAVGSYLTSRASGKTREQGFAPAWNNRFGANPKSRMVVSFLGGALMMMGARMAKGCTSGHAITGTMQGAVSSWVFTPLMFTTSVLAARGIYGRKGAAS
jgi:hypothetical protein